MIDRIVAAGESLRFVCGVLQINRATYYSQRRQPGRRRVRDGELKPLIQRIFWQHRRRYGARRIRRELAAQGRSCSLNRLRRLMKEMRLLPIQPRSFRPRTTQSRHPLGYDPNRLRPMPPLQDINRVWVADITYIPLKSGQFVFLATLMDLFSRRIVGWQLQATMDETLVVAAWRTAFAQRQPGPSLIHHSDRGGQYAGQEYRRLLAQAQVRQSMSRAADCYDNAFMESCFGTIKRELEMTAYDDLHHARREVASFIRYYNILRRHSSLAYLSPAEFEWNHEQRRFEQQKTSREAGSVV